MNVDYPTVDQPATPEYIMAVFRDMHRQQCQYDSGADPLAPLTPETTVEDWRDDSNLVEWQQLGRAHNEFWGVSIPDAAWRAVLEPAPKKRLADVCDLLAGRVRRPVIRPARLLEVNCVPAGAFLTIRSLLGAAGERTAGEIAPSTPVAPFARRHLAVFLGPVSRLAPGSLPPVRVWTPVYDATFVGIVVAAIAVIVGLCTSLLWLAGAALVLLAASYALNWYAARCLLPASVEFGELRTFRDLSVVIANGNPA